MLYDCVNAASLLGSLPALDYKGLLSRHRSEIKQQGLLVSSDTLFAHVRSNLIGVVWDLS